MSEELSAADRASLAGELGPVTMAFGELLFEDGDGMRHEQVLERVGARLHLVPRYPPASAVRRGRPGQPRVGRRPRLRPRLARAPSGAAGTRREQQRPRPAPGRRRGRAGRGAGRARGESDGVFGSALQEGNTDTVGDLTADATGSLISGGLMVLWSKRGWGLRRIPGDSEREETSA